MINGQDWKNKYGFITQGIYKQNYIQNNKYRIEDYVPVIINNQPKLIGEGRFSKVYLYKHKNNESLFALKKISIKKIIESGNNLNIIKREIDIHSRIQHENIVQFYSVKQEINEVDILLEYCRGGSIYELISKNGFDEYKSYSYFSQVVNAVYFLHNNNLVHRDIKPENILVNCDKIKLCDFGWCCETKLNNRKTFCGTFEYMAPEIINELPYGKPVDIWALGILLYELYYGISPFMSSKQNEEQTKEIINNILHKKLKFLGKKDIPYDMKDLIINMLQMDVFKRYTIEQVAAHPWFKRCREEINKKNHFIYNIPFKEENKTNITKITKIIKNKNDIMNKSIYKFKSLKYYSPKKKKNYLGVNHAEKENIYKNNYNITQINSYASKLRNIDINVNEDDYSPSKSYNSYQFSNSFNNNSINNRNLNSQKENKKDSKYYYSFENNNPQIIKESYLVKRLNSNPITVPLKEKTRFKSHSKLNVNNKNISNFYSSVNYYNDDYINSPIFFPMDNVLEETSRGNFEGNNFNFPIQASVTKLQNENNENKNLLKFKFLNNNNHQNQLVNQNYLFNQNRIINNNYINNNINQINNYDRIITERGYTINYNNSLAYPSQNQIFLNGQNL